MSQSPIICFGQQPCGFFPKRFLASKIFTARRLQKEIGGEVVFFYHDSDHDPRETKTVLRNMRFGDAVPFNFDYENKFQRKFSPLYLKRVPGAWHAKTARQLPAFVPAQWLEAFKSAPVANVADFCLEMYRQMGLVEGIRVARSSDPTLRQDACDVSEFFVDVPWEGEVVRARYMDGGLTLHEGGTSYITLPTMPFTKQQISPTRDSRLRWMQSVVHCTHYICGAGEAQYMNKADAPEITYVPRDTIERSDEAYTEIL